MCPPHNSPHYQGFMRRPTVIPGYYPSSEMGPKSHTTITTPSEEARTCLLIRQLLIRELAVPPRNCGQHNHKESPPSCFKLLGNMNKWLQRQIIGYCGPHYERLMQQPPVLPG
ncbi:hypothetical protein AVEN_98463-1 [Araneus ventricosus]|uniref:Uncharacterized protein n=1 Tax=Araneus ventricosus TaxID=182803 RepID=A0A4Y2RY86_ARAVE|nr:hypothetical protein AVEN_98463-1 [Araneus ventricosus]